MIRYRSYAKLNLFLDITGIDGPLHTLDMIMQSVSLYDELTFQPLLENRVEIVCDNVDLQSNNIIEKAFRLTQRVFPQIRQGFRVTLNKKIPMGAGLAGGSGNAAATVHYLLTQNHIKPSPKWLRPLLLSIGSDVAFCYRGGTQRVRGVGDVLRSHQSPHRHFLIVSPHITVSSAEAYRLWDAFDVRGGRSDETAKDPHRPYNAFEQIIFPLYPEIACLKSRLLDLGATEALMSGSGSAVFGIFKTKDQCEQAEKQLNAKRYSTWVVRGMSLGVSRLKDVEYSC